ncbi:hypothetical protein E8E15_003041 [Penicillium rubens]|uniref:Uncharacterized protein n=1 Tax=Penicillium chrysogenum TaxID=5076 RepID=A0ABQ8WEU9_PENCH|nr:hypothetical protein E8E15_003041 [Penicillium rubens]KAJ5264925.1 hypothetical protein N7505_007718 [Penicillium chrysogenum]
MSTSSKADNAANPKQGAFKPSAPGTGPITNKGHQIGRKVNEADQRPEYHAQTFPRGSAPASNSYTPNNGSEVPPNPYVSARQGNGAIYTSAADTLVGDTSGDVNRGLGKPIQGQTNTEHRHDGQHSRKGQKSGLEGVGASRQDTGIERRFADQRGLEREEAAASGTRGDRVDRGAEEQQPESAETLARERKYEPSSKHHRR